MRFGLCTDIRNVKMVESCGFDYIDGKLNQIAAFTDEEFSSVLSLMASSSLKMERASLLYPKSMALIGKDYDEKAMGEYLNAAFKRMNALSCPLVVFGSGKSRMLPREMAWRDGFLSLVHVTQLTADIASSYGIEIAIETLNRSETNMINTLTEGAALMAVVNRPNVGLLADAYHMRKEGEDMEKIIYCSPLMHTHIALKDGRAFPSQKCEEVEEFFAVLKKSGYDGTMSIEGKSDNIEEDSVRALEVLREYDRS